jgi:hypothetical protein
MSAVAARANASSGDVAKSPLSARKNAFAVDLPRKLVGATAKSRRVVAVSERRRALEVSNHKTPSFH